jgi:hypothetical protein
MKTVFPRLLDGLLERLIFSHSGGNELKRENKSKYTGD